jgi:hypothetical protein
MLPRYASRASTILLPLSVLILAFSIDSCGKTEASHSDNSIDTVMKVVHDYGHNDSNPVASRVSEKPAEAPEHYFAHITDLLVQEDFAQLEKIAQQNRFL